MEGRRLSIDIDNCTPQTDTQSMSRVRVGRSWSAIRPPRLVTYVMTRGRVSLSFQLSAGEKVSKEACVLVRQRFFLMSV